MWLWLQVKVLAYFENLSRQKRSSDHGRATETSALPSSSCPAKMIRSDQNPAFRCEDTVFNSEETCADLRSVHPLQDAFDAVGYFHLALAAALEDRANPEALYVVYMKLAEIHGNHMPDAQLCQVYRDRAQTLKRVLAGEDGNVDDGDTGPGHKTEKDSNVERAEIAVKRNGVLTSTPDNNNSFPRTCVMRGDTEDARRDANTGDSNGRESHSTSPPDADGPFVDAETDFITSRSYSESIFTESFDTAKEQISDSSSSTDTLQTHHNQTGGGDCDTARSRAPAHINHASEITRHAGAPNTDSEIRDEENSLSKETDAPADQSDADQSDTVSMSTDKAEHMDLDDVYT